MSLEQQLINWLAENLPPPPDDWVAIGDDAAVLSATSRSEVVTTDMVTDGVDFHLDEVDPQLAGRKALAVNLSDLAAMAAKPRAAFVSLVLPRQTVRGLSTFQLACELFRGMLPLAERVGCLIAGGDTNTWDGPLALSITALGEVSERGPLLRSGAKVGDDLFVTGELGGSILGRHLTFEPRVSLAQRLHQEFELHAGLDISDGLAIDAARLAAASGCGIALELASVPISEDAVQLSRQTGKTPLEHALGDGEDFELLLAVPSGQSERMLAASIDREVSLTRIGRIVAESGLWQIAADGSLLPLAASGFQHEGSS